MWKSIALSIAIGIALTTAQTDPSYDHQTKTYTAKNAPVSVQGDIQVTPYFSPVHSSDVTTYSILAAQESVDLGIPGFDSWSGCTPYTGPVGCTPTNQRNESFPVFQALLNALLRGVKVRILTNNYNTPPATGLIDPLTFLYLNGAQVRYFNTVTFLHAKYMMVDSATASVSSINFSYTSFMENREAGVLINGTDSGPLLKFMQEVYEFDWAQATPFAANQQYSSSAMKIITDPTPVPVIIPPPRSYPYSYAPPLQTVQEQMSAQVITSPDQAYDTITKAVSNAQQSFSIMIYQITGNLCDVILNAANTLGASNIQILVSDKIYSETDWKSAQTCYSSLYNAGLTIRKTAKDVFTYSHQKFWIIDGTTVFLSTGNWSPTDYPNGSDVFPPYGSSSWRQTNRDFTVMFEDSNVVNIFQKVLDEDYSSGSDWYPYENTVSIN